MKNVQAIYGTRPGMIAWFSEVNEWLQNHSLDCYFSKPMIKSNGKDFEKGIKMKEKVSEALNKIRPSLQADGGDVELVDVTEDGVVQVKLRGACAGCPMATLTLKNGIERRLREEIPEIKAVEEV